MQICYNLCNSRRPSIGSNDEWEGWSSERAEMFRWTDLMPRSIPGFPTLRLKLGPSGDDVVLHEMQSNALCDVARSDPRSRMCGGLPTTCYLREKTRCQLNNLPHNLKWRCSEMGYTTSLLSKETVRV